VCNQFSYGSKFSTTSIFNEFGTYGSAFSSLSAYNEFTTSPPSLACEASGAKLNPVSRNKFVLGSPIDPDALCATLANAGR
jgi:hypothetical protein